MRHANRFTYSPGQLSQIAQTLLGHARTLGASACECGVSEAHGLSVSVRKGEVETLEHNREKDVGVSVYLGARPKVRRGHASTSDFSPAALGSTVEAALAIARFTAEDDCSGLPEPECLAREQPDLDLYHPWEISPEEAIELARRCEAAAFAVSPKVKNSEGATVSTQDSQFVIANSEGFTGGFRNSRHTLWCSLIAEDRAGMQRDDWYSATRVPERLADPVVLGRYAAERALARLGARKLSTRQSPVLFEAPLAAGLIGHFVSAVSGGSLYRKSSFLLDSLGKQVFASGVSIDELPLLPRELASSPFDEEGVATCTRQVVADGVLQGYFLSSYSARKLGLRSTGSAGGNHNLIVRPGEHDFRGMLKAMNRGLLVTELLGQGVNMVTGDYSRGAAGYWVENGEIAYAVEEITIAGNLRDMYQGITAVGNDVVVRGSRQSGSILVENMTIAGN
ncbi:MAG: metalloprotease PmbA [Betaproteobacteria bacterium]|nr:metalloprotease PmbA [Betaproteobacteria bacterium]